MPLVSLIIRLTITIASVSLILFLAFLSSPTLVYLPTKESFPLLWIIGPVVSVICGACVWKWKKAGYLIFIILAMAVIFHVPFYLYSHNIFCWSIGDIALLKSECYYQNNPLIDTILPKEFSEEKFKSIQTGMSKEKVIKLLGNPANSDNQILLYGDDGRAGWWDFAWVQYTIHIDIEEKVTTKERNVYHD
ncbi:hypothetical protein CAL7716_104040 (plasmid) [Calothrix sp. PCC 7716]|nr:hypothetical protein CAL7716_104040 [Calothrix sp. PCC 7716]